MIFGLLGKSLQHSFSKRFFSEKFEKEGLPHSYENFELADIGDFPQLLQRHNLAGLNVTIPYKTAIIPYLDKLAPAAAEVGAVNTLVFSKNGQIEGHNTDVLGFRKSLKRCLRPYLPQWPEKALVLGTGGAAKAVQHVLEQLSIAPILVSRSPERGDCTYAALEQLPRLVINTTPLGTYPNTAEAPPLPYEAFSPQHLAFDLVYNPAQTLFLKKAAAQGAGTCNGYEMLEIQALAAWDLWNARIL